MICQNFLEYEKWFMEFIEIIFSRILLIVTDMRDRGNELLESRNRIKDFMEFWKKKGNTCGILEKIFSRISLTH
jgi:endo-1,4-beta-D-glucanase Y